MKVVAIQESFGLDHLQMVERPNPSPGAHEVVLRMRAVSLNYRDLLMVRGHYGPRQPLPLVPCSDGVGEVVEVGAGVTRVAVGDRVCPIFAQKWIAGAPRRERIRSTLGGPHDGTLSEYMCLNEEGLVHVPEHLSDTEAATLPCAAVTAWNALVTHGGLAAGQSVLIQGTGGVAIFALQLAGALGLRPIVISSSDEKLARVREMGAVATLNYRQEPKWGRPVKKLAGGEGVDLVVELGGAKTINESLRAVRPGGCVSLIGVLSGTIGDFNVIPVFMQQVRIQGILVGHRESFEALNAAVAAHELRPVIDRTFPLEDVRQAFEYLATGAHFGKICVEM